MKKYDSIANFVLAHAKMQALANKFVQVREFIERRDVFEPSVIRDVFPEVANAVRETKAETNNVIYMVLTNLEFSLAMMEEFLDAQEIIFATNARRIWDCELPFTEADATQIKNLQ